MNTASAEAFFNERKYSELPNENPDPEKYPLYSKATRTEYILNEGEMLFIPSGWWHHVFSDDVGSDGINFAINYWYEPPKDWTEGKSGKDRPMKKKSTVPTKLNPISILRDEHNLRIFKSTSNRFTSDLISYRYPDTLKVIRQTFNEWWKEKDPYSYVLQYSTNAVDKFAPPSDNKLMMSSIWANFGNVHSHLHYDNYDNWLCQVKGNRRVYLFPPEDREYLYVLNPYSLDNVIRNLVPRPAKKYKVKIGTYSFDGNLSFLYTSSLSRTMDLANYTDILFDPDIIATPISEIIVRNEFFNSVLNSDYTHLFLIGRDMGWDPQVFIDSFKKSYDIVGVPYRNNEKYTHDILESAEPEIGIHEATVIGFGFAGFSRHAIRVLSERSPLMNGVFDKKIRNVFSTHDDAEVCEKMRKFGFKIKVFTDFAANRFQSRVLLGTSLTERVHMS